MSLVHWIASVSSVLYVNLMMDRQALVQDKLICFAKSGIIFNSLVVAYKTPDAIFSKSVCFETPSANAISTSYHLCHWLAVPLNPVWCSHFLQKNLFLESMSINFFAQPADDVLNGIVTKCSRPTSFNIPPCGLVRERLKLTHSVVSGKEESACCESVSRWLYILECM